MRNSSALVSGLICSVLAAACSTEADLPKDRPFLAVSRDDGGPLLVNDGVIDDSGNDAQRSIGASGSSGATGTTGSSGTTGTSGATGTTKPGASVVTGNESFFLAINKAELGERWFMSAYLKQVYPGAVGGGAGRTLGTLVVTFKVQNDKLYVFSADDLKKTSDTFNPEVIIDAYPIIKSHARFSKAGGAENFVLFDPASGVNRFTMLGRSVETAAAYMQRQRAVSDGITYEMVFTGSALPSARDVAAGNTAVTQVSGTLGLALRRYAESPEFRPAAAVPAEFGSTLPYFVTAPKIVPNAGKSTVTPVKWSIKKGMTPITWVVSNQFDALKKNPTFKDYDVTKAIIAGIESWNAAFGFKVFEAKVASDSDSFADDDTNYFIYDGDPTYGAAFANWRTNPNTGEIRGASIYFNGGWVQSAIDAFGPQGAKPPPTPATPTPTPARVANNFAWGDVNQSDLCFLDVQSMTAAGVYDIAALAQTDSEDPSAPTLKDQVETYLKSVAAHEVGHTLGLRHNFKGSLVVPSSSVMDYLMPWDAIAQKIPGDYDTAALQLLYGLSTQLPTFPFCNDAGQLDDPECTVFDSGASPFTDFDTPWYVATRDAYLDGKRKAVATWAIDPMLNTLFLTDDDALRATAFKTLFDALRVGGVDATKANTDPAYGDRAEGMTQQLLRSMIFAEESGPAGTLFDSPLALADGAFLSAFGAEVKANLLNGDKLRGFETRRTCVDILKKLQSAEALDLLADAQAAITTQKAQATSGEKAQLEDLLSRIDAATHPYFTR